MTRRLTALAALGPLAGLVAWVAVSARRGAAWAEDVVSLAAVGAVFGSFFAAVIFGIVFVLALFGTFRPLRPPGDGAES